MIALKYFPKSSKDVIGHDEAVIKIDSFIQNFKHEKKKALLIHGPSGTGKTSTVHALANELDLEVMEINASDVRNKDAINRLVGESSKQHSLFAKGKIILVDELEGISGNKDRGGLLALTALFNEVKFPLIMTTTDIDLEKIESLKSKCNLVEFERVQPSVIYSHLEKICSAEGIDADPLLLKSISRNADGDVRAALLDLDILTVDNKVHEHYFDALGRASREAIHETLVKVLKGSSINLASEGLMHSDVDIVDLSRRNIGTILFNKEACIRFLLEENLPYEYSPEDNAVAFDYLSKSDVFHGRIARWQYYRFLVYVQGMLASVSGAKSEKNPTPFELRGSKRSPKHNKKIWFIMNKRKDLLSEKLAGLTHNSKSRIKQDMLYYRMILKNSMNHRVQHELELDEKDVAWIMK